MLTVHHLENSRSQRVLWLLEELAVPYEIVKYARDPKTSLGPPELQKIHPLGKSPVITDDGTTVAESAAILEYVAEKYGNGKLIPAKSSPEYQRYRYFMHYAEGSVMPILLVKLITRRLREAPGVAKLVGKAVAGKLDAAFVKPNVDRHVPFIANELGSRPYFCGAELTLADIQMSFPMEAIAARIPDAPKVIHDYVARIHGRPAFKAALDKGGPYDVMD
ncbi:MAG TPA: glutathione S-transferase [Kofleriaceae bacterium]|nr:glutathione S-transferase [Kofleriaceae bacterium]